MGLSHRNEALLRHAAAAKEPRGMPRRRPLGSPHTPMRSKRPPRRPHCHCLRTGTGGCSALNAPPSAWRDYPSWAPVTAEGGGLSAPPKGETLYYAGLRNKHGRLPHQPRTTNANTAVDSTKATEHYRYSTTLHTIPRDDPAT